MCFVISINQPLDFAELYAPPDFFLKSEILSYFNASNLQFSLLIQYPLDFLILLNKDGNKPPSYFH
jgi:hypothetical protein